MLIIIAVALLFPVLATLGSLALFGALLWPVNEFLWTSIWQSYFALGTFVFFLGVPLIALFFWIIRLLTGAKKGGGVIAGVFGAFWLVGWVSLILFIFSVSKDVRFYEHSEPVDVVMAGQPVNDKLTVLVSEPRLYFSHNYWWLDDEPLRISFSDEQLKLAFVGIKVVPSTDDQYAAIVKKYSAGSSYEDATSRAEDVEYEISYDNGVLDLGNSYSINKENKFRGQFVEVEIRVPEGKKIRFDESLKDKLNVVCVEKHKKRKWVRGISIGFDDSRACPYKSDIDYVMGSNGKLRRAK